MLIANIINSYVFFCANKPLALLHKIEIKPLESHDVYTFLGLESGSCVSINGGTESFQISFKRSSFVF